MQDINNISKIEHSGTKENNEKDSFIDDLKIN